MMTIIDRIERRCRDHGEATLLVSAGTPISGDEFWSRALRLSEDMQELGVVEGSRVALSLPASDDLYVAIVAAWLARAAFVPVDPREASGRREAILAGSGAVALLASATACHDVAGCGVPVVGLFAGQVREVCGGVLDHAASAFIDRNEAYVIYTSGSAGDPKGVSVGHAAIDTYLTEALRIYDVPDSGVAFPLQLPLTFDAALTSILPPLVTGNVAVPILDEVSTTRGLADFLRATEQPVLVKTTPSQLALLRDIVKPEDIDDLRGVIVIGGEPLSFDHLAWIRRNGGIRIFNEYGPTEATVGCSVYRVSPEDPDAGPVPIGTPHGGAVFTIEPEADTARAASSGELIISGPCLANGYVNQGSGGFIEHEEQRHYRTGDWVRRDADGKYYFLARRDDQVKINGIRVELGEVEEALRAAAGGRPAAVVATDSVLLGAIAGNSALDVDRIKADLCRRLPSHMRPTQLHTVPRIPLTAHGKFDRRRLRQMLSTPPILESTASPRPDPLSNAVHHAWTALLGPDHLRPDTDFFAVGDSMTALRLVGRLTAGLGQEVPASLIFDNPTLKAFTSALRRHIEAPTPAPDDSGRRSHARTPAPPQTAIVDAERWAPEAGLYTVVDAVSFDGVPTWSALLPAIDRTVARHDIFSWRFDYAGNDVVIAVDSTGAQLLATPTEIVDLRALPADQADAQIDARLAFERQQPVRLIGTLHGARPRAIVFRLRQPGRPGASGVLALVAHHAVVDELSMDLLWREIFARAAGIEAPDAHDSRYLDWAVQTATVAARRRALRSADELIDHLCTTPLGIVVPLPDADTAAAPASSPLRFAVPAELNARCIAAAATHSVPVSAIYGAAIVRALGALISERRFAVFMPMTLRRRDAEFDTVGCFVASVPVLAECPPVGESVAVAINRWHRAIGFTAQRADADQAHLTERFRTEAADWFATPRISLAFELGSTGHIGPVTWSARPAPSAAAKHDLSIYLTPGTHEFAGAGRLVWRESRGDSPSIAALVPDLVDRFLNELDALCGDGHLRAVSRPQWGHAVREITAATDEAFRQPSETTGDRLTPVDAVEEFATLATELLGQEVGAATNLFEAGARSLDLMQLTAEIARRHGVTLRPVDVFDFPTPADIAALVRTRQPATPSEGSDR